MAAALVAGGIAASGLVSSLVGGAKGKKQAKQAAASVGPVTPIGDIMQLDNATAEPVLPIGEVANFDPNNFNASSEELDLTAASKGLLEQTDPLRTETINRALRAMLGGGIPEELSPIVGARRSVIQGNQAVVRSKAQERLAAQGLGGSSIGNATLEGIDRETSSLLTGSDMSELERLNQLGETLGFGAPLEAGMAGLKTSASLGENRLAARETSRLATEGLKLQRDTSTSQLALNRDLTLADINSRQDLGEAGLKLSRDTSIADLNLRRGLGIAGIQAGGNAQATAAMTASGTTTGQLLGLLLANYLKT